MTKLVAEWVDKAEGDFRTAERELRVRKLPNYDSVCFHSHQCIEKYLKAFLHAHSLPVSRTHNLPKLLISVAKVDPAFLLLQLAIYQLNIYSVEVRYPGVIASKADARAAVKACREVRSALRLALGLPAK